MPREGYRPPTAKSIPTTGGRPTSTPPTPRSWRAPPVSPARASSINQTLTEPAYLYRVSIPVFHHCPLSSICLVDPKHVEHVTVVSPPQPGHGITFPSGPVAVRPMQNVHCVRPLPLQYVHVVALASAAASRSETGRRSQPGMEPAPLRPTTERKLLAQVALDTGLGVFLRRSRAAARDASSRGAGVCLGAAAGVSASAGSAAIRGGARATTGRQVQVPALRRPVADTTAGDAATKAGESMLVGEEGRMKTGGGAGHASAGWVGWPCGGVEQQRGDRAEVGDDETRWELNGKNELPPTEGLIGIPYWVSCWVCFDDRNRAAS